MKTFKFLVIGSTIFLLSFFKGDKSYYTIPQTPWTIFINDIDLDGDIDIFFGHSYSSNSDWGGISLLTNISNGYFELSDSSYFKHGFPNIDGSYLDDNEYIDIF